MHAQTFISRRPPSWKTSGGGAASHSTGLKGLLSAAQFRPGRLTEEAPLHSVFKPLLLFYCLSLPSRLILSLLLVFSHTWTALRSSDDLFRTNLHFPLGPFGFSHSLDVAHVASSQQIQRLLGGETGFSVCSRTRRVRSGWSRPGPSSSPTGWACVSSSSSSSVPPSGPPHWIFKIPFWHIRSRLPVS